MAIKVVVVDDQRLFRQSLVSLLKQDPEIQVVGQAADGLEAFSVALEQRPDIVLMDLDLPKLDGAQATKRIVASCSRTKVVILSVLGDEQHIANGLDAGAAGYILKDAELSEFIRLIKRYAQGSLQAHAARSGNRRLGDSRAGNQRYRHTLVYLGGDRQSSSTTHLPQVGREESGRTDPVRDLQIAETVSSPSRRMIRPSNPRHCGNKPKSYFIDSPQQRIP
jgi:DNA-binding NarL/FixJ family response regulator